MSLRQALRARFRSPEKPDGGKESASAEEPSTSAGLSASWKTLEEDEDEERRNSQTGASDEEVSGQPVPKMPDDQQVFEVQLTLLQEQLVAAMIENQTLATELESCKSTQAVLTLKRDLEYEREKSHQLAQQLDRERASGRKTKSSADDVDIAHEATEDLNLPQDQARVPKTKTFVQRLNEWMLCTFYELAEDFSDVPDQQAEKPEDQLAVKKLKDNIKRFKEGTTPLYRTVRGIHGIFAWKHPAFSLIVLLIYMYSVWKGWLLPVVLFVLIQRLFINYLRHKGLDINMRLFTEVEEESDKDSELSKELKVSDKFNLVLQVATQVQNKLGLLSDSLEKLKNLFLWKQPEATCRLFSALVVAFVFSCLLPGTLLFMIVGLYMGFKMFVIEYIHTRYPRFKERHDTVHQIWQTLPTDSELDRRHQKAEIDRQILPTMEWTSEPVPEMSSTDLSKQDRTFCERFSFPLAERPLSEWRGGRRCTFINRDKSLSLTSLMSSFKNGKMYLTRSFLCFELAKPSSTVKDVTIPLADITKVKKAKPYTWMPGAGMSIEVTVVSSEKPYLFGALLSRDECYDNIMTHAYKANLPWGSCAGKSRSSKDSRSQSEGAEGTNCEDDAATLGDQPLRMSSLQDDEDLLGLMNEY